MFLYLTNQIMHLFLVTFVRILFRLCSLLVGHLAYSQSKLGVMLLLLSRLRVDTLQQFAACTVIWYSFLLWKGIGYGLPQQVEVRQPLFYFTFLGLKHNCLKTKNFIHCLYNI